MPDIGVQVGAGAIDASVLGHVALELSGEGAAPMIAQQESLRTSGPHLTPMSTNIGPEKLKQLDSVKPKAPLLRLPGTAAGVVGLASGAQSRTNTEAAWDESSESSGSEDTYLPSATRQGGVLRIEFTKPITTKLVSLLLFISMCGGAAVMVYIEKSHDPKFYYQ